MPAIVSGLIGVLVGQWLQTERKLQTRLFVLYALGLILILLGYLWSMSFPLNKNLWSSSYVLFTGGMALIVLTLLHYLLDVKQKRYAFLAPFHAFGVNAIAAYVFSMLLAIFLLKARVYNSESTLGLQEHIYHHLNAVLGNPYFASLGYASVFCLIVFIPVWGAYKKDLIFKI